MKGYVFVAPAGFEAGAVCVDTYTVAMPPSTSRFSPSM